MKHRTSFRGIASILRAVSRSALKLSRWPISRMSFILSIKYEYIARSAGDEVLASNVDNFLEMSSAMNECGNTLTKKNCIASSSLPTIPLSNASNALIIIFIPRIGLSGKSRVVSVVKTIGNLMRQSAASRCCAQIISRITSVLLDGYALSCIINSALVRRTIRIIVFDGSTSIVLSTRGLYTKFRGSFANSCSAASSSSSVRVSMFIYSIPPTRAIKKTLMRSDIDSDFSTPRRRRNRSRLSDYSLYHPPLTAAHIYAPPSSAVSTCLMFFLSFMSLVGGFFIWTLVRISKSRQCT